MNVKKGSYTYILYIHTILYYTILYYKRLLLSCFFGGGVVCG